MDIESITRKNAALQQQACRNLLDALDIFQDAAERISWYWAGQAGIGTPMKTLLDPYLKVARSGRHSLKRLMNDGGAAKTAW
jgi:hypothetical protein